SGQSVRGHVHESRVSVLGAHGVLSVRLNPHVDYDVVPSPPGVAELSLALPVAIATDAAGERVFVAAMGSDEVAILSASDLESGAIMPDPADHVAVSGGGPVGLAVDDARGRLYVPTRFDDGVSVVDLATRREIQHLRMFDPEPEAVREGRRYLYDARISSSNGENACASCHVFGHLDALAWDLCDPDLPSVPNPNAIAPLPSAGGWITDRRFHPMKGPMTTQTLRGIARGGPMHWRGDRTSGALSPADSSDERASFLQFAEAFEGLLGRAAPIGSEEMESLATFALSLVPPPNPIRRLDDSLTPEQADDFDEFSRRESCRFCHVVDEPAGFFGTDGHSALNPNPGPREFMKVPSLRGLYEKVGMFWTPPGVPFGSREPIGDQVRGFGILNDGSSGRLPPATEQYLLVFPTDLKPIVGQQVTLRSKPEEAALSRVELLRARAGAGDCDLVASAQVDGESRGFSSSATGEWRSDRRGEDWAWTGLLRHASRGNPVTILCAPPGTGERVALDRDLDGALDHDEVDAGSDPADAASVPDRPGVSPGASDPEDLLEATARLARRSASFGDSMSVRGAIEPGSAVGVAAKIVAEGARIEVRSGDGAVLVARSFPALSCRTGGKTVACRVPGRPIHLRLRADRGGGLRVRATLRGLEVADRMAAPIRVLLAVGERSWLGTEG
ncbi:MAG: hypothetical protein ACKOCT_15365, partial [Alphaproteobacteria bacterium]